jgi:hypothetical protein
MLANWDSSEAMSEAASENGSMRAERAAAAFQNEGSQAYLTASPAPFSDPDTEPCRYGTSPAVSGRHWLEARSGPVEDRKTMILSETHFQASCLYSYLETQGLARVHGKMGHRAASLISQPAEEIRG